MALIPCTECGAQISDRAASCPQCGVPREAAKPVRRPKRKAGYEYRSERMVWGRPLVHVAFGRNPETGKVMVARGFIAIGTFARGFFAIGSFAMGVFTIAGVGLGLFSFAGVAIGLLAAAGGVAIGGIAAGGLAIGGLAVGGLAIGYEAFGGLAIGCKAVGCKAIELCRPK